MNTIKPLYIVMLGMQGSGKGTYGKKIAEHYGLPLLVTGNLFREEIRLGTELGLQYADVVKRGELAPDHVSKFLIGRELAKPEFAKGAVIDGYPRTYQMAKDMETMIKVDAVVYLKTTSEETIRRIINRRQCEKGHVYNLISVRPKQEGICDIDGLPIFQREDDHEETIKNRLRIFHQNTEPLIDYFRKHNVLIEIDACCEIGEVADRVLKALESRLGS